MDPNLILLGIALLNAITALFTWWNHRAIKNTQEEIHKIEVATNSMKDKLVAATAQASEAKGRDEQRAVGEQKAADLIGHASQAEPIAVTDAATQQIAETIEQMAKTVSDPPKPSQESPRTPEGQ